MDVASLKIGGTVTDAIIDQIIVAVMQDVPDTDRYEPRSFFYQAREAKSYVEFIEVGAGIYPFGVTTPLLRELNVTYTMLYEDVEDKNTLKKEIYIPGRLYPLIVPVDNAGRVVLSMTKMHELWPPHLDFMMLPWGESGLPDAVSSYMSSALEAYKFSLPPIVIE